MSKLSSFAIDAALAKLELEEFGKLLGDSNKPELGERADILPFFKKCKNLCSLMGFYNPYIIDRQHIAIAHEFDIFGDHVADLLVGDISNHSYCFIEFENAANSSIFRKSSKATPEWSPRYEHGFSQLVDWIHWLENNQGTAGFQSRFNAKSISYNLLLVIGRDKSLEKQGLRERFEWRTEHVVVASKKVVCITYDKLYRDLLSRSKSPY